MMDLVKMLSAIAMALEPEMRTIPIAHPVGVDGAQIVDMELMN